MRSTCNKAGCGAQIRLLRTENGKMMPLDVEPNDKGNVVVLNGLAHVLKKDEEPPANAARMMPHFATCVALQRGR